MRNPEKNQNPFFGQLVRFTGKLQWVTQSFAAQLVRSRYGFVFNDCYNFNYLVQGDEPDKMLYLYKHNPNAKLISELEFLEMAGIEINATHNKVSSKIFSARWIDYKGLGSKHTLLMDMIIGCPVSAS